jgi:hypothetical protein
MKRDSRVWRSKDVRIESRKKIFGLPIVSIAIGPNPERAENRGLARGFIAIGDISVGVFSFGGLAFGVFSFGGASVGLASVGGLAVGIISLGGAAIGLLAAVGGVAIGFNAVGSLAIGSRFFDDSQILISELLRFR